MRKGRQFVWGKRTTVLHMPDKVGIFQLYSDTSKYATGGALYQIQNRNLN